MSPRILGPALALVVLGTPAGARAAGSMVVIRFERETGEAMAGYALVARCPGLPAWRATTDADGVAVIADVPPCPLSIEGVPDDPDVRFRTDRLETSARAVHRRDLAESLPTSGNAWSLLETGEPAAVLDRIDGAGLHLGEPGRFALRGASWTQNSVSIDGVD